MTQDIRPTRTATTGACHTAAAAEADWICPGPAWPLAKFPRCGFFETGRAILRRAFDLGATHFDLANNYGPPFGSAEENFGRWMAQDFRRYRDELIISTKAGYDMWPGPYGDADRASTFSQAWTRA